MNNNKLVEVREAPRSRSGRRRFLFQCECGGTTITSRYKVTSGHTKSCGCLWKDSIITHGKSKTHPLYSTWQSMKARCSNPNHKQFDDYGGRGITVCDEWNNNFDKFVEDMGDRPSGYTLERLNNSVGYTKDNCVWASRSEQQNNRRNNVVLTYEGLTMTATQWSVKLGLSAGLVGSRLRNGWSIHEALTTPKYKHKVRSRVAGGTHRGRGGGRWSWLIGSCDAGGEDNLPGIGLTHLDFRL